MTSNIPNEEKELFKEKMQNRHPPKEQHPTISFEYYQPLPPKKQIPTGEKPFNIIPYLPFVGNTDIGSTMNYNNYMYNFPFNNASQGFVPPVVVKSYNMQADTINGQQRLSTIYQDAFPPRKFSPSHVTLKQRLSDHQFIRATILNNADGKNIDINGLSSNSINSHIQIDLKNVNPYNTYKHSPNPYKGLPYGFLLFRSCYPIKKSEDLNMIKCSQDSTAINIRIYRMTEGSFYANKINKNTFFDFDEWREVAFYEYIRENILKKKVCPHFANMYGYFISENSLIDYDSTYDTNIVKEKQPTYIVKPPIVTYEAPNTNTKIDLQINDNWGITAIPYQKNTIEEKLMEAKKEAHNRNMFFDQSYRLDNFDKFNDLNNVENTDITRHIQNKPSNIKINDIINAEQNKLTTTDNFGNIIQINPKAYIGKSLVILSESPTYSILNWASKIYAVNGNIHEMIGRGFHDEKEWKNILFQIMIALYVMQINNIFINDFSFEKNVFIKDLSFRGTATEFWKYKIDGIDYYIPNLGFLVLIDSDFNNIDMGKDTTFIEKNVMHKLNGNFCNDKIDANIAKEKIFDMFKCCFDTNNFGEEFKQYDGILPPPEIMSFISKIMTDIASDTDKNIGKYIFKFMREFMHNRIGTYLKEAEVQKIKNNTLSDIKRGDIMILGETNGTYKFVLYVSSNNDNATILTKTKIDDIDIIEQNCNVNSLQSYIQSEAIVQNFKPNEENLTEEGLLETYIVMKN